MARLLTDPMMVSLLPTISTLLSCGPAVQDISKPFTVSEFTTLPVQRYTLQTPCSPLKSPVLHLICRSLEISTTSCNANIFDVLERQGRRALIPNAVITSILGQLENRVTYEPMECQTALDPTDKTIKISIMSQNFITADNTVTSICPTDEKILCVLTRT
ncbi:hypothetical protein KIN20_021091 [Parelaphostrongylus tenuis]|uniref:Uncharacterized protein n=1 Tax=Parelaphostrongylus tenuis TaxID=148309 RepID=A0AAD5N6R2_PARTN|nr:hypothetical protein KIN20_021091 [Parelaphostrongylus tenuis]